MTASKQDPGDEYWMAIALEEAVKASEEDEVPIGAVLVLDGKLIARDHNRTIQYNDPTAHAEILVLRSGASEVGNYRLLNATLYVTVEPCAMCTGALIWSRVKRLVYGTCDDKAGCVESKARLLKPGRFNHNVEVAAGIISEQCRTLLRDFFSAKRK